MKEWMRKLRADLLLTSVLCVLLGIVLIVWTDTTIGLIGTVFGVMMVAIGAVYLLGFVMKAGSNLLNVILGAIVLLLGVWILIEPSVVATMIPIVLGVLLVGHGIRGLREAWASKTYGFSGWIINMVLAAVSIGIGVYCILKAFAVVKLTFTIIGIALIYNGVSDIWIALSTSKAEREYVNGKELIDVEVSDVSDK